MLPMFRLFYIYFLLFMIIGFWPLSPCNDDNYFFFNAHAFPLNFALCVCYVCCLCLCNVLLLVVV